MAREIKFRAWNEDEMLTWENLKSYDPAGRPFFGLSALDENKDLIWMQYTGLKDKNGIEIYEGDILQWSDGYPANKFLSTVEFRHGCFVSAERSGAQRSIKMFDSGGATTYTFRVIGNIYQNPELLRPA